MFGMPKTLILGFILSIPLFVAFPQIDLWFTGLFYDPQQGFFLAKTPWAMFVYYGIRILTVAMVLSLLALIGYCSVKGRTAFGLGRRAYVYLLLVLFIGPGLLSTITKDNWHRARPVMVEQFGGTKHFSPAFIISDQCDKNCSFISGHPTTMYYFYALALVGPLAWRRRIMAFAIVSGLFVGWVRVIQGGHFLSDVITSGFVVIMTAYVIHWLMYRNQPPIQ